jgi:isopenicillin N synthase-like dioxygenase
MSDEGSTVPLPSPDAEQALRQAVVLFRQGKRREAAKLLQSSFSTAFSRGRTYFDALHFANAITRLRLVDYITDEELRGVLMVEEMNPLIYTVPDWLQGAYREAD